MGLTKLAEYSPIVHAWHYTGAMPKSCMDLIESIINSSPDTPNVQNLLKELLDGGSTLHRDQPPVGSI